MNEFIFPTCHQHFNDTGVEYREANTTVNLFNKVPFFVVNSGMNCLGGNQWEGLFSIFQPNELKISVYFDNLMRNGNICSLSTNNKLWVSLLIISPISQYLYM